MQKLDHEMKRMESEMKGTVDINYQRYNTEIMAKVAKYNQMKKAGHKSETERTVQAASREGAKTISDFMKGKSIHY